MTLVRAGLVPPPRPYKQEGILEGLDMQTQVYPEDMKRLVARMAQQSCKCPLPITVRHSGCGKLKIKKPVYREFMAEPLKVYYLSPEGC